MKESENDLSILYSDSLSKSTKKKKFKDLFPKDYHKKINHRHKSLRTSINKALPFINDKLTKVVPFYREQLIVVASLSGHGKSTTVANIAYALYKAQKKTLIVSYEESAFKLLSRIACLELGYHFNEFKYFTPEMDEKLEQMRNEITKYLLVLDYNCYQDEDFLQSLEGTKEVLDSIIDSDVEAVVIDYYSKVTHSLENPNKPEYKVLTEFSYYLEKYIKLFTGPVVITAQLWPPSSEKASFQNRLEGSKSIYRPATVIIEVLSNKDEKKMVFKSEKVRDGVQSVFETEVKYDKGKLV